MAARLRQRIARKILAAVPGPAASLESFGDLLRGLGGTVGQVVSCYVRAGTGASPTWTHFLLPFGTPATPLPVGIWFNNPGTGVNVATAHATAKATIDPAGLAAGTTRVLIDLNLQAAPALTAPRLQIVICTERGVLAQSGQSAPARLGVAVIDVKAPTTAGLPQALQLTVTLPPNDRVTTKATVGASVTPRTGQTTAPLRVGVIDGVVTNRPALLATSVGLASLPAGLDTLLGGLLGGTLGGLLGGPGLTVTTDVGQIHTVDSDGPVSGLWADLVWSPATAGSPLAWSADIETPSGPGARPAVTTNQPGGPVKVRYSAAILRTDGSESVPGAESAAAGVSAGLGLQVTLPAAPAGVAGFAGWQVYRARLANGAWATAVPVGGLRAPSTTFTDTVPATDPAATVPPVPAALKLTWRGPNQPNPLALHARVDTVDEVLDALAPPARPTTTITADVTLPPSVVLDLRPSRGTTTPTTVHWESSPGAARATADVRLQQPRTGLDVHVTTLAVPRTIDAALKLDTPALTTATWTAVDPLALTASAYLPGANADTELVSAGITLPRRFSVAARVQSPAAGGSTVDVGYVADAATGPITVRLAERPAASGAVPTWTDARVLSLGTQLAIHAEIPPQGAVDPPLLARVGGWSTAPTAGTVATAAPSASGDAPPSAGLHVIRRAAAAAPTIPVWDDGPGIDVDIDQLDGNLTLLDIRTGQLRSALVDKKAGTTLDLHVAAKTGGGATTIDYRSATTGRPDLHLDLASPNLPDAIDVTAFLDAATLATATWNASDTAVLTGSVQIPGDLGALTQVTDIEAGLPASFCLGLRAADDPAVGQALVTAIRAGWSASGRCGPLRARVTERPATGSTDAPSLTDARVQQVPQTFAAHLRLPAEGAQDPPLLVEIGDWEGAPAAGTRPLAAATVVGSCDAFGDLRLVRRPRPATLPPLPARGRGPGLAADIRSDLAGLQRLDVRAAAITRLKINKAQGADTDVRVTATLEPTSARIQLTSVDATGPGTIQVRARRLGPEFDLRVKNRAGGLLDVTLGPEADAIEGLRVFQESGGTADGTGYPVASHQPTATSEVTAVIAALDRLPRGRARISLHPVGTDAQRPMRVSALLDDDADVHPHRLRLSLRGTKQGAGPTHVDVDAALPHQMRAVLQGDAGTLGPDTGAGSGGDVALHDPLGVFEAGWKGRRVRWASGAGTISDIPDVTHLTVTPDPGSTTPAENEGAADKNWYWIVDTPGRETGVRVHPSRPIRARIAAATIGGWGLCGITTTPQLRVESEPDLVLPTSTTEPARGAAAGLSVRVAGLVRAAQSSWSGDGEMARLLGTLSLPAQADVLAEVPGISWLCADVQFKDRPVTSLLAVLHQQTARPAVATLTGAQRTLGAQPREDFGRDALRLRLFSVPDGVHLRLGPGAIELDNSDVVAGGAVHAESALWFRPPAPFAEAGYGSTVITTFPAHLIMASGVAMPDLGGGVTTSGSKTFGSETVTSWTTAATRIVVGGGDLELGRNRSVAWDGPRSGSKNPWDRDPPPSDSPGSAVLESLSVGSEVFWSLSDVWFMRLMPTGSGDGELLLFTPGEPHGEDKPKSAFQARATSLAVTARILKVKLGAREMVPGQRAALVAGSWLPTLAAEIQLDKVQGAFAVGMDGLGITDWLQTDQSTAGHWWMCAYGAVVGIENAQFGSSFGTIDLRDAPWNPYWA